MPIASGKIRFTRRKQTFRRRGSPRLTEPHRYKAAQFQNAVSTGVLAGTSTDVTTNLLDGSQNFSEDVEDVSHGIEIGGIIYWSTFTVTSGFVAAISDQVDVMECLALDRLEKDGSAQAITLNEETGLFGLVSELTQPVRYIHRRFAAISIGALNQANDSLSASTTWGPVRRSVRKVLDTSSALLVSATLFNPALSDVAIKWKYNGTLYYRVR